MNKTSNKRNNEPKVFFTSDTHYSHKNICRGVSNWEGGKGTRDFENLQEMNDAIVDGINSTVGEDDILYHDGDWSFGGFHKINEFRRKIKCKNVHLILGNHDVHIARNKQGVAGNFSSVAHYRELEIEGQKIVMSHYPMIVWNNHFHGAWMLFGHCHGSLDVKHLNGRKTMDIGIDIHPEFRPYSFEELKEIMDKKSIHFIDHHDAETSNH